MDLSNKPFDEIVLRLYPKPNASGRELVKKACLGCGLLNPQDSRDVIVDVLNVLIIANKNEEWLTSKEIELRTIETRKYENLSKTSASNIRRILKVLKDYEFIIRVNAKYRINGSLKDCFQNLVDVRINKIIERNKEYFSKF
jgi:hypothetical protein